MTLKINQKILLIMLVLFSVPVAMFTATMVTVNSQKDDSLVINLAGRQRMLTQKMSKECLTYLYLIRQRDTTAAEVKKTLLNTMEVFDVTLKGLIKSGMVPLSLNLDGKKQFIPAAQDDVVNQLKTAQALWNSFRERVQTTLKTGDEEDVRQVLTGNLTLLAAMDKATGMMQQQAESKINRLFYIELFCQGAGIVVVVLAIFWSRRAIIAPIRDVMAFSQKLADGDLRQRILIKQHDELGLLTMAVNQMAETFNEIIRDINRDVKTLRAASQEMNFVSGEMAEISDLTVMKAGTVSAAAEETDSAMNSVAAAMEQAYINVNTVAAATEEMSTSVAEITQRTSDAAVSFKSMVEQAHQVSNQVNALGNAAEEIGAVSDAIASISDKTSLLALNATIEAARAGDAGKGFTVVANEIKELSRQTAGATGEIAGKLADVQRLTDETISMIETIASVIENVSLTVFSINESVEQQSLATQEISRNIQQTSQGLKEITQNVSQTKDATGQVAQEITEVNDNAEQQSNASAQVQLTASRLNELSEHLTKLVSRFHINDLPSA